MSNMKVIVKDFEIIADAKVNLEGLVAVVGESNNGKTALYNALKVLVYNIQGTGYIRRVKGQPVPGGCLVGVMLEEGSVITFEKSSSPVYKLTVGDKTVVLDKAGRGGTPVDIATVLNMLPIDLDGLSVNLNFVDQMSEPLLKSLSEYQMYKIAVKSFDGEKIQEAIALCKTAKDKSVDDLKKKSNEIEIQKRLNLSLSAQLEQFDRLSEIEAGFDIYNRGLQVLPVLSGFQSSRDRVLDSMVLVTESLKKFVGIEKVLDLHAVYIHNSSERAGCIRFHNSREDLIATKVWSERGLGCLGVDLDKVNIGLSVYRDSEVKRKEFTSVDVRRGKLVRDIFILEKQIGELSNIPDMGKLKGLKAAEEGFSQALRRRVALLEDIEGIRIKVEELQKEIEGVQYMLDNDICPLCKKGLSETHKH